MVTREEAQAALARVRRENGHIFEVIDHEDRVEKSLITPIDWASIGDTEPPPRRFLINQWMPAGCLSSLYGPGGVGKSLLAQQTATSIATGLDFLGHRVEQAPVLALFSEDDDEELIRRQWRINQAMGIMNKDIAHLHIQGRAGLENAIATIPLGAPRREALFEATVKLARERNVGLVILDNRAQMLLVNENDRAQATFAANLCAGIGREANNAATLLLGHVAKVEGSEYSGSTAWDAVTRSRWWLKRAETEEKDGSPELILERPKSNYAPPGAMRLVWANGVLRAISPEHMTSTDVLEMKLRQGAACQAFLDALDTLAAQGRPVSHSKHARATYAPRFMHANGLVDGFTEREIETAMNILFADGRIEANVEVGKTKRRQPIYGIARKTNR
jgi:RecA-family ATPase